MYVNEVNVDKPHEYNYSEVFYDNRDSRPKNSNKRYEFETAIENKNAIVMHMLDNKRRRKMFNCLFAESLVMCRNL